MGPYTSIPGFENIYLEDSFVLDIEAHPGLLRLRLDAVLTEDHPEYSAPGPDEQYCYRSALIQFNGVTRLHWLASSFRPAVDANDEIDYGGIDQFGRDGDTYVLAGDFGQIDVEASGCTIEFLVG